MAAPVSWRKITGCRACGGAFSGVFCDLGAQPLANAYVPAEDAAAIDQRIPLRAVVCSSCRLVQLEHLADCEAIFSDYAYLSSMSAGFVEHAGAFCRQVVRSHAPRFVVELASNDGYLLQHFARLGVRALGVEPAANVAALAQEKGIETLVRFFDEETAAVILRDHGQADLVVANNVLAHVPDVNGFVAGMARLLAPQGIISVEFPHLLALMRGTQFDTIYHEHYAYLSLHALEVLLARHGLAAVDVEPLDTHGGSLRVLIRHAAGGHPASEALVALRRQESHAGIDTDGCYAGFNNAVERIVSRFRSFLQEAKAQGLRIAAYGAAAKGNTFLNAVGDEARDILCVADRSPFKQCRLLPGTHIPIVSPEEMAAAAPDVILVLPWNIADEVERVLVSLGLSGRQMVTAIPDISLRRIGG